MYGSHFEQTYPFFVYLYTIEFPDICKLLSLYSRSVKLAARHTTKKKGPACRRPRSGDAGGFPPAPVIRELVFRVALVAERTLCVGEGAGRFAVHSSRV